MRDDRRKKEGAVSSSYEKRSEDAKMWSEIWGIQKAHMPKRLNRMENNYLKTTDINNFQNYKDIIISRSQSRPNKTSENSNFLSPRSNTNLDPQFNTKDFM